MKYEKTARNNWKLQMSLGYIRIVKTGHKCWTVSYRSLTDKDYYSQVKTVFGLTGTLRKVKVRAIEEVLEGENYITPEDLLGLSEVMRALQVE